MPDPGSNRQVGNSLNELDSQISQNTQSDNSPRPNRSRVRGNPRNDDNRGNKRVNVSNLSRNFISRRYHSKYCLTRSYNQIRNATVTFPLTVRPDYDRLKWQSEIWARTIVGMPGINFRNILSSTNTKDWVVVLSNVYVYSYFKCLLYGLFAKNVSLIPLDTYVVYGHALMTSAVIKGYQSFVGYEDINVYFSVEHEDDDILYIEEIVRKFTFLEYKGIRRTGFSFENPEFDRILKELHNKCVNGPLFLQMGLDDHIVETYFNKENFPFLNSFYVNIDGKSSWSYCHSDKHSILDISTLFGKALFFTLKQPTDDADLFINCSDDDEFFLVQYELKSLTGYDFINSVK